MNGRIVIGGLFVWQIIEVPMREVFNQERQGDRSRIFSRVLPRRRVLRAGPNRRFSPARPAVSEDNAAT